MKMRKWLDCHFVCQIVTLKCVEFSYREIQEKLKGKSKSTVSNAYLRYKNEILTSLRCLLAGQKKLTEKDEKKLVTDGLTNPMVTLAKVRVDFKSLSTKASILRPTIRKILK